ncbi:MAG: cytochrome c oxidase subunit I [Terriglobia bacterium]
MGIASAATLQQPPAEEHRIHYLNAKYGLKSWFLTTDHKRIAWLYFFTTTFFFIVGGIAAALMRLNLLSPEGAIVQPETYNKLFTIHGTVMIFFFLAPVVPTVLGNFLIPMMIGARDVAFPRLNLLSWYIFVTAGCFLLYSVIAGGVDTGWTFYTPLSTTYLNTHVISAALAVFISGFSSILTGLNFIVTIHKLRCPGLTWFRLPLFIWSLYASSFIFVLAMPVIAITMVLLVLERLFHVGIFDPALGGDPILFQHLFWFFGHPEVYILILPSMGVISELVAGLARRRVFGYGFVAFSSFGIAIVSFLVWGHHMFVSGQSVYAGIFFSAMSMAVAIPSAVKVFNWTATLYKGSVSFEAPMLYAIGFIGLFTIGGLTGVWLACMGLDIFLHDTYFIVAHFHYVMVGGAIMGYMGGLHYWWPKMTGKLYPDYWARLAALIIFIGFNLTFGPQFILGFLGMPRRYATYPPNFQFLNIMSSAGASILAVGYAMPVVYLIWSIKYGKDAGPNPFGARGLEWETSSPPPVHNFDRTPVVTQEAYAFESPSQTAVPTVVS